MIPMTLLILMVTAISCGLIGSFLVLRNLSMISDAISHSVLLGIVIAFFLVHDIGSPYLILGATLFGLVTVYSIETLTKTGLVKNDDAVGMVFPLFFSIAIILISKYARNAHLDLDIVLMGEVILAPLNTIEIFNMNLPKSLVQMSATLVINLVFIVFFFKELKITTFDEDFATLTGFSSFALFYGLMTLTSLTSVVAFDAVGAILVVSFLIAPGASAYLVSKSLKSMLVLTAFYGVVNSLLGYYVGAYFNVSLSGMTAAMAGLTFGLTFLFNKEGLLVQWLRRRKSLKVLPNHILLIHMANHRGKENESVELGIHTMHKHMNWSKEVFNQRVDWLVNKGLVETDRTKEVFRLTEKGEKEYLRLVREYGI